MKRLFTLMVSVFAVTFAMAQAPEGVFAKASVAPEIDGVVDEVWAEAEAYNIDQPFREETPTFGEPGETTWQGLWTEEGIYLLLIVNDDGFLPAFAADPPTTDTYLYDKPEIYLDVNFVLGDGGGPLTDGMGNGNGHYQVAPGFTEGQLDGTPTTQDNGIVYAFLVEDPNYIAEYFIPFSWLVDGEGVQVDPTNTIGFDVTLIDRDPDGPAERQRAQWANIGGIDENWSNMDDAGHVTFEGAEPGTYIDAITLNEGGTITEDNGTLQMVATIDPEDATNQVLRWSVVNGTGQASIDDTGLLTAIRNGTVTVVATATDGWGAEASADVEISGQAVGEDDIWNSLNLISNWDYTEGDDGLDDWGGWLDPAYPDQLPPVVEEGAVAMKASLATDAAAWHYQHSQSGLNAEPNVPYVLHFKSWATGDAPAVVDFEDIPGNDYNRYGASTDPEAVDGRSEWNYTLTTEPQWFTFHVTFDQIVENTIQKLQYMISLSDETIYLDSVLLVTQEDFDLLGTVGSKTLVNSINKVYPNPVGNGNALFVELSKVNTKVAIHNAVGQKLMEKVATGNLVKFDVSSLRQGLYFVKLSDGSIQKFVR